MEMSKKKPFFPVNKLLKDYLNDVDRIIKLVINYSNFSKYFKCPIFCMKAIF